MGSHLFHVNPNDLDVFWPRILPFITGDRTSKGGQRAIDEMGKMFSPDDIKEKIKTCKWQLWISLRDLKIEAIGITQLVTYPKRKVCQVFLISGSAMYHWIDFEKHLCNWAKAKGCSSIEAWLRKGWKRYLKKWEQDERILMRKQL